MEAEGIVLSADGRVDLKRYGWEPARDLSEEELQGILDHANDIQYEASAKLVDLMQHDPASPLRSE